VRRVRIFRRWANSFWWLALIFGFLGFIPDAESLHDPFLVAPGTFAFFLAITVGLCLGGVAQGRFRRGNIRCPFCGERFFRGCAPWVQIRCASCGKNLEKDCA
jgi:hypothetical protein